MHTVAVLALPDTIAFDLSTPLEVFGRTRRADGRPAYRVLVCGAEPVVTAGPLRIGTDHGLEALRRADTVVVPGRHDPTAATPAIVLAALRDAAAARTRIASICVGAFTLAAAGLLDGLRATTHWSAAAAFRTAYPTVDLDPDVLFVDTGQVVTSAGATAGIDMCLHLVGRDFGVAVAADTARLTVAPLHRDGGQAQYIVRGGSPSITDGLLPVLQWLEINLDRDLTLDDIAARAGMSTRTLNRRFQEATSRTPLRWLSDARIRRARELLETTEYAVDRIGERVGFSSPTNFRAQFKRAVGVTPQTYRATFRGRTGVLATATSSS